jgi:hypothetical protein
MSDAIRWLERRGPASGAASWNCAGGACASAVDCKHLPADRRGASRGQRRPPQTLLFGAAVALEGALAASGMPGHGQGRGRIAVFRRNDNGQRAQRHPRSAGCGCRRCVRPGRHCSLAIHPRQLYARVTRVREERSRLARNTTTTRRCERMVHRRHRCGGTGVGDRRRCARCVRRRIRVSHLRRGPAAPLPQAPCAYRLGDGGLRCQCRGLRGTRLSSARRGICSTAWVTG